eukprot:TRINITY_DN1856_c0_g1_i1.p1 TRINITY_DN1856_c0_g1~~TRINITY_DN1856_c0_g1_i1.p1  ORF type:complete len:460 (-),score=59.66 TRINITY_DN1856_c0_g1_i1:273-1652(-)
MCHFQQSLLTSFTLLVVFAYSDASEACTPYQVHTAVSGRVGEMQVVWSTKEPDCLSRVQYWKQDSDQNGVYLSQGRVEYYEAGDMCSSPAIDNEFPQFFIHHAVMTGLEADTKYEYLLGESDYEYRWFNSVPEVSFDTPVTLLAIGDTGQGVVGGDENPGANQTFAYLHKEVDNVDLILHVGDLAYADGDPEGWYAFMNLIEPVARHVPYMVTIGNHEFDYDGDSDNDPSHQTHYQPDWGNFGDDSGGECGVPVIKRFPPVHSDRPDQNTLPFWYSYDYGNVHVITLSSEHSLGHPHPQYTWLKNDLASIVRCRTPWVIVTLHRPMYIPVDKRDAKVAKHIRHHIEDILIDYEVDLVISGHFHAYYRTCLVHDEDCKKSKGITQLVVGNGGRHLDSFDDGIPDWMEAGEDEKFGFAKITTQNGFQMKVEIIGSQDGELLDEFSFDKEYKLDCPAKIAEY